MSRIHFFALSERWSSAANNDAFCAEKVGNYHLFGVAEGLTGKPGLGSASGVAIASLIRSMQEKKGSPAAALNAAVHDSEARIPAKAGSSKNSRDVTHMSAAIIDDSLESTILDTGDGHVLLVSTERIVIPRDYPAAKPVDILASLPHAGGTKEMISHTLGEPRLLKPSDFALVNIKNCSLLISSGGLHDYVSRERIAQIIRDNGENVETACQQLVQEAQRAGSEKTITIVLVHGHEH